MAESKQVVEKLLIKDLDYDLEKLPPEFDLELGINDKSTDGKYYEMTILGYAMEYQKMELFYAILKTAAKYKTPTVDFLHVTVNFPSNYQNTPIMRCLWKSKLPKCTKVNEMLRALIKAGALLSYRVNIGAVNLDTPIDHILKNYPGLKQLVIRGPVNSIPTYLNRAEKIVLSAMIPNDIKGYYEFLEKYGIFPNSLNFIIINYLVDECFGKEFLDEIRSPVSNEKIIFHDNLFKLGFLCYLEDRDFISGNRNDNSNNDRNDKSRISVEENSDQETDSDLEQLDSEVQKLKITVKDQSKKIKKLEAHVLDLNKQMKNILDLLKGNVVKNEKTEKLDYFETLILKQNSKGLDSFSGLSLEKSKKTGVNDKKNKISI